MGRASGEKESIFTATYTRGLLLCSSVVSVSLPPDLLPSETQSSLADATKLSLERGAALKRRDPPRALQLAACSTSLFLLLTIRFQYSSFFPLRVYSPTFAPPALSSPANPLHPSSNLSSLAPLQMIRFPLVSLALLAASTSVQAFNYTVVVGECSLLLWYSAALARWLRIPSPHTAFGIVQRRWG